MRKTQQQYHRLFKILTSSICPRFKDCLNNTVGIHDGDGPYRDELCNCTDGLYGISKEIHMDNLYNGDVL